MFVTCVDFGDTHLESFPDLLVLPPVIYQLQQKRLVNNFDSLKRHTFLKDFKFFDPQRHSIFLILKMFFFTYPCILLSNCNFDINGYIEKNIQVETKQEKNPIVLVHRWLEPFTFI